MVQNVAATRVAGTLKKHIIRDIAVGFGLGLPAAYGYWHYSHMDLVRKRESWYREYAQSKSESDDE